MKTTSLLTLVGEGSSLTICRLSLNERHYYFSVPEDNPAVLPNSGLRELYPDFKKLWEGLEADPFQFFPETDHPLPEDIAIYLKEQFEDKKQRKELNVFLVERWEKCLMETTMDGTCSKTG